MDGWMDGLLNGWIAVRMDQFGWLDCCTDEWIDRLMD